MNGENILINASSVAECSLLSFARLLVTIKSPNIIMSAKRKIEKGAILICGVSNINDDNKAMIPAQNIPTPTAISSGSFRETSCAITSHP